MKKRCRVVIVNGESGNDGKMGGREDNVGVEGLYRSIKISCTSGFKGKPDE